MIGGARSAKSPRDQPYIYFACFEGRATGGCREGEERQGTGRRTWALQQCGIWRVTRSEQHAMQFSCRLHHQSVLARSRARTELPDCSPLFPYPCVCSSYIAAPLRSRCDAPSFPPSASVRVLLFLLLRSVIRLSSSLTRVARDADFREN